MKGACGNPCFLVSYHYSFIVFAIFTVFSSTNCVRYVGGTDYNDPAVLQLVTQFLYSRISNITSFMSGELGRNSQFCIKNPEEDWERSFNFSSNMAFLSSCVRKTRGDVTRRLCTKAEIRFYFNNFLEHKSGGANLMLNKNCNLKNWVSGCEPGWGCSIGPNEQVNLGNSETMPVRVYDCDSCCEGFFCPQGLTCMIPCPLGSYCPTATLNKTTGTCEPYGYQLPPERENHTCGGANIWADVGSSSEVFCSPGSYCPTTTKRVPCSKGHYCKMGSTTQERCFKLTSCNPNSARQNMHAYGIMVIAALTTLLLMFYNCSDQMLTNRARKEAKTREAAAKSARETARAREKWKSAKDTAKKHAFELQSQLSRTFSRKKSVTQIGELKIPVKVNSGLSKSAQLTSQPGLEHPYHPPKWKKNEHTDLMKMMHAIEDDHENFDGIILSARDNNTERHVIKEKQINTHSQIFKYAYAQIEREKAYQQQLQRANKHLTFSGVVSLAANPNIKKRPLVEVSFKDLGLILKRKNVNLLRCVSGVIKPGHITAVMGPSGAGKTSLLSALAGKSTGCRTTGYIFINGRAESIHSYKKIVGFVPQDDIVYGNLTVEENLWFSASCRLSAKMRKADKVLIVERVIENLGLQSVRDSVVGTVEKRGISGGQRKRVNVGLELVVEPSLLFLDEPTSGLDSSSSQLLLRALRHETLEGLNICMVVHQPSYTLFEMFDDLILLAKGGLPVYHGSAKGAEDYFSKLGIFVPERVNPPDYFIDILEGLVKSGTSSTVSYEDLPVRWMLHNGYTIPSDMQKLAARISDSPRAVLSSETVEVCMDNLEQITEANKSFVGEMWEGFKYMVEQGHDNMHHVFFKYKDLSTRNTPGIFSQYRYFLGRVGKQRLREARIQAVDYLILLLAGSCLGSLTKVSDQTFGASAYTYTIIAVSLLCKIAALRSFSLDKLQYLRERASGISSLAHFLSKDTIDLFNTMVKPVVYLSMFYFFNNPRSSFADNYVVLMCLVYCVSGIAYLLAILFDAGPAQLWSALLPVVLTLIATQPKDGKFLKNLANFCYPKWALEAFVISNAERYYGVWLLTRCGSLLKMGYSLHSWNSCIFSLILAGLVARSLAFFSLLVTFRNK